MPRVVGTSVSTELVPLSKRWVGCICHLLNTIMKRIMNKMSSSLDASAKAIQHEFLIAKTIFAFEKHSNINSQLPEGYEFIQEFETSFGTTCDAIERFLKPLPIVAELGSEEINKHLLELSRVTADDGSTNFSRVVDQDGS